VRRQDSLAACRAAGALDEVSTDLNEVVSLADLVLLCTPIGQMTTLLQRTLPSLKPGAIVTDVGSVKGPVVRDAEPLCRSVGAHFVGSHPMAGSEKAGVAAARTDLFESAVCVVTPTVTSDSAALVQVEGLWRALGARVLRLRPEAHDEFVAHASHLPQALAASLAHLVLDPEAPSEQAQLCAGGFRDGTRIASGSPEMWRDIFVANRQPVIRALDDLLARMQAFRQLIQAGNAEDIQSFLAVAKERRDAWVKTREARSRSE
jgi:prephenate dehydrogenase